MILVVILAGITTTLAGKCAAAASHGCYRQCTPSFPSSSQLWPHVHEHDSTHSMPLSLPMLEQNISVRAKEGNIRSNFFK